MTDLVEPPAEFVAQANATGQLAAEAERDPMRFWDEQAGSLTWARGWDEVLDLGDEHPSWFVGGRLSVIASCLDRHVRAGRGDRPALVDIGADDTTKTLTYADLYSEVRRTATGLRAGGVRAGDEFRIDAALPRAEIALALLACAFVGAVHHVVVGGDRPTTETKDSGHEPTTVDSQHPWCTFTDSNAHSVTHETGPLLTQVTYSTRVLLDVKPRDVVWSSLVATNHLWQLHAVYGTLANGACILTLNDNLHEEARTSAASLQRILRDHAVDIALVDGADAARLAITPASKQSRSPRLIATTSPINEDAWWHLHRDIGGARSVVTTVWGSPRTGGLIVGALPGVDACAPACAMGPLPGVVLNGAAGELTLAAPAPGVRVDVGSRIESPTDPALRIS